MLLNFGRSKYVYIMSLDNNFHSVFLANHGYEI